MLCLPSKSKLARTCLKEKKIILTFENDHLFDKLLGLTSKRWLKHTLKLGLIRAYGIYHDQNGKKKERLK